MSIEIVPVVCGLLEENAYIVAVRGRQDCVIVDPGDDLEKLRRALGQRRLGAILLTHGHFDHTLAAGFLAEETGAQVYLAEGDVEMLDDPELNAFRLSMGDAEMKTVEVETQDYGDTLSVCGIEFEILPTPGHSRGSVCLYLKQEGILFSGDTLFRAGYGRMDLYGGDVRDMLNSLKRLFKLPPELTVYPGHGAPTTIGEERARYRL